MQRTEPKAHLSWRMEFLYCGSFCTSLVFLLAPGLFLSQVIAFRDTFHFYYPQAEWLNICAKRGELFPVWNGLEGLGNSISGQPSAGLYYPLRLLLQLPFFTTAQQMSFSAFIHLLIAAVGIRIAAGRLGLSQAPSWLAAIAYALSCPVFYQTSNFVYLNSAAWIGFAIAALLWFFDAPKSSQRLRFIGSCALFAFSLAMMALAGDAHAAINSLLLTALVITAYVVRFIWYGFRASNAQPVKAKILLQPLLWFLLAGFLIACLTSAQVQPARKWLSFSGRTQASVPLRSTSSERLDAILAKGVVRPHKIYDFSLSPWNLASVFFPTFGGNYQPSNSRWQAGLPGEGRMWIPSLYFGFLPAVLAVASLRRRYGRALLLLAILSLLAAMGSYSMVWLLRQALTLCGATSTASALPIDPVGSIYWLCCKLIPEYDLLRYPAKWSVFFSAFICLYTAQLMQAQLFVKRGILKIFLAVSIIGVASSGLVYLCGTQALEAWLVQYASDKWLGNPSSNAVLATLMIAFGVPAILLAVSLRKWPTPTALVGLTLMEMTFVASSWIDFVPSPEVDTLGRLARDAFVWADSSEANIVLDYGNFTDGYSTTAQCAYQQQFLIGKLGTLAGVRSLHATQSIDAAEVQVLRAWLARHDTLRPDNSELDAVLAELGVTHRLVREASPTGTHLSWRTVPESRPMCQIMDKDSSQPTDSTCDYQWINSSELQITLELIRPARLIVRQFNDEGWLLQDDELGKIEVENDFLFVVADLPPGAHSLVLKRVR